MELLKEYLMVINDNMFSFIIVILIFGIASIMAWNGIKILIQAFKNWRNG
jgi:hypothetical protein